MIIKHMTKEDVVNTLYYYLQYEVSKPSFENNGVGIMPIETAEWRMFQWKIKKELKPAIIKIWEKLGLVKKLDRRTLQFIKTDFNINDLRLINTELKVIPDKELGKEFN